MFEDARSELTDVLSATNQPVPVEDAREAVDASGLTVEGAINQFGTVQEHEGTKYLVAMDSGPSFSVEDLNGHVEPESEPEPSDDAEEDEEPEEDEDDHSPSTEDETDSDPTAEVSWSADGDVDLHTVNGVTITSNPARELVGEPTGDDWYGLPVLGNGHDAIPNVTTSYFPVEVDPGNRDTEEWMGRVLGGGNPRPMLFEGDAGSGKNTGFSYAAHETNRIVQRINFGSDVSVFDLVGEKEVGDGQTYYILGDLAKAAMFGHFAILDEVNMVTGDVSSFLHGVCEEPGDRSLELRGTEVTLTDIPVSAEEIEEYGGWYYAAREKWNAEEHLGKYIHPEFRVGATCNPLDYADTKVMNDAFRDRFVVIEHDYLGVKQEAKLLAMETGAHEDAVKPLVRAVHILREARSAGGAHTTPVGHRPLLKTVELAGPNEGWMSHRDAAMNVIVEHASEKKDKQYIRDTLQEEL